jgi:CRISPR-associated protein Cmr3
MTIWIIEPHDPLIVRDGRPFSAIPGAQAVSRPFPFPSTTTGGVRTRAGLKNDIFDIAMTQEVKKIKVRGPLLVQLAPDQETNENPKWLVSAPADALIFGPDPENKKHVLQQLVPLTPFKDAVTDFDEKQLSLVGLPEQDPRKPSKEVSRYWYWDKFEKWLLNPAEFQKQDNPLANLGHNGPQREHRTHVGMEADQRIAKEGALFGTSGLEFTAPGTGIHKLYEAQRLALAVAVDESEASGLNKIQEGIAGLGGERRIVSWRKSNDQLPSYPQGLVDTIISDKACRVILLTPAHFAEGYRPIWLTQEQFGIRPELKAIAIQRPQVASGWDLEKKGPKHTRRLAPAGTVIFLKLEGRDGAIRDWVNSIWMQCVSDNDPDGSVPSQSRDDGFGLAVLGTWSGKPVAMGKEQQ